nr:hybrid signal transduction histidine kinase k [Quercus suber]
MNSMNSEQQPSIFTSPELLHAKPHTGAEPRRRTPPDVPPSSRATSSAHPSRLPGPSNPSPPHSSPSATPAGTIWASFAPVDPPSPSRPQNSSTPSYRVQAQAPSLPAPASTPTLGSRVQQKRAAGPTSPHLFPEPAAKRPRFRAPRSKHTLDALTYPLPDPSETWQQRPSPPSPLFFSNRPRVRPSLPPRFSSSEAAATMLSKAGAEEAHVKTVSLARGTITPGPTSVYRPEYVGRKSQDRSTMGGSSSPEGSTSTAGRTQEVGGLLGSIGVTELLEQDERPTFIVDLADASNEGEGPLRVVFENQCLRSFAGMHELVTGAGHDDVNFNSHSYMQFKTWLLSAAINGESLNVCLPSFVYADVTWSCTTLRKRLRVIAGVFMVTPSSSTNLSTLENMRSTVVDIGDRMQSDALTDEPSEPRSDGKRSTRPLIRNDLSSSSDRTQILPTTERHQHNTDTEDSTFVPVLQDLSSVTPLLPQGVKYVSETSSPVQSIDGRSSQIPMIHPEAPSFDWTRLPLSDLMPPHIQFARGIDWASTSLGPIEEWQSDLRQMCNLIMASPHPAAMYWGKDLIAIYNEAYILLAGQKHPALMGQPYREAWSEIWDDVKDVFASAESTGEATMKDDDCLFIRRSDYLEETYFSWSIIPMVGQEGSVIGLYNPAFEKTRRKIAERRMLTLREVGERTASARDVKAFWAQVLSSFEFNEYDSPFLMLYSVADEQDSDASSIHSNSVLTTRQCTLEGTLGIPMGHCAAPEHIDLHAGMEGFGPVFREVMKTDRPVLLDVGSRDLPESLVEGLGWRGFGDPIRAIVVRPIHPTTGENILGFLVVGVNPRRPYDDDYNLFIQLLSRQLATSLASVVLFEEEIRRGQRAAKLAALDRIELSEQLAARTQEAIESETKFTRMAEFAPVGMFIAGSDGRITFANDTWYDISRVPRNGVMADTWMDAVKVEDLPLVQQLWQDLVKHTKAASSEFRFKAQWEDKNGKRNDTWVLFSAYPERYEDGRLKSVFGSLTNISQQKWAEGIQTRKMEEAVELKRQQENFIDITSHEMRNPLSAILQCADEISSSMTKVRNSSEQTISAETVAGVLDAAQIINLCSQHQKRIVDDILTLSKLDSQLLLVTPVDAQPLTVVQRALKMHENELQAADIQMKFIVDQSFHEMGLDWVRFDPTRVMQVLINLTTNAIKFTGSERKRTIIVTIAASTDKPSAIPDAPVKYFATRSKIQSWMDKTEDWGTGEKVYIHFAVKDTGRGLNLDEKKMLFLRFSQASPRTHVQYGGSGLGLFISRELTELQGGEIGVESEAGLGSTFAFYVAARRSQKPEDVDEISGAKRGMQPGASGARTRSLPGTATTSTQTLNNSGASTSRSPQSPVGHTQTPKIQRALIVEDNLVNQRVLQKQLKNLGVEVHLANHGGEALEKLKQSTYWHDTSQGLELGVVLMDQEMPVMDGLTCTRRIRELERQGLIKCHVPIIAVTANARPEQIKTAMDAGMDAVVSKPFRIPELVPKIDELMERFPAPSR